VKYIKIRPHKQTNVPSFAKPKKA